ncbi:DUF533 domain-containing protein [Rhodobacterales bacterium HKCCE2091]|nr:DUF533 domain-containing protein [Rhodobacterales bacterium HKCCE2091]
MRFLVPVAAALAVLLPSAASAARIPIPRVIEEHLDLVSPTLITGFDGKPLALCHYYETQTVFSIGLWMSSNGYVLSDSDCEGAGYIDDPALIAQAFEDGRIPGDVPATPAFTPVQYVKGFALIGVAIALVLLRILTSMRNRATAVRPARRTREDERREVLGIENTAVFRVVDAMLHAAKADGRAQPEEIAYIRAKATELAQLDYTDEHVTWALKHTEKLRKPSDFKRFGHGITPEQARVVLRAALAVVAADGKMTKPERRYISQLSVGLDLGPDEIDHILGDSYLPNAIAAA